MSGRHIGAESQVKAAGDVFEEIALALGPTIGKRLREAIDAAIDDKLADAIEELAATIERRKAELLNGLPARDFDKYPGVGRPVCEPQAPFRKS
jgi:predicted hydrocarbon binding protein